ncbi:MAG: helix-turn-helix domain-containing protein [Betaproteobacteria bacterium]|nr:helix-turn-helix domain-containing protein [Betaproteobacteria bacterium]
MTDDIDDSPVPPLAADPSAGARLAAAREKAGLAVADVARHLKLTVRQVEALEADDYGRMPGAPFVRGFVRNYAKFVGLDPEPLVASLHGLPAPEPAIVTASGGRGIELTVRGRHSRMRVLVVALIVLLVALPLFFHLWLQGGSSPTVPHAPTQPRPMRALPRVRPAPARPAPPRASSAVPPAPQKAPAASTAPAVSTASSGAAVTPGKAVIKMAFAGQSWVEIRDQSGKVIFARLNPAGTSQAIAGVPPFHVVVGDAPEVTLTYNGNVVDLAPTTRNDVARLTLK